MRGSRAANRASGESTRSVLPRRRLLRILRGGDQSHPHPAWYFAAGRGAQEKTFAELKGEFALDVVPTNHYGANSAWLQLSIDRKSTRLNSSHLGISYAVF